MQKHDSATVRTQKLPATNPDQPTLPGTDPLPKHRYPLLDALGKQATRHRYLITATLIITTLYLVGQGTIATGLLFAIGLHQVNAMIDARMGGES